MDAAQPNSIAGTRRLMREAVAAFRARAAGASAADVARLAARTRAAVVRAAKLYRHHIEDRLRRDATRRWGLNDRGRLGEEAMLREALATALGALEASVKRVLADPAADSFISEDDRA